MPQLLLDNLDTLAAVVTAVLTAVALFASWRSWRKAELRRDEVQRWADESIAALQSVWLITGSTRMKLTPDEERVRLVQLIFDTSVLVERGRLFFRNARSGHGSGKQRAYRGKRPEILDQLVLAHQIACAWPEAPPETRAKLGILADAVARRFVTLVQAEIGRVRTASPDTRRRGDGIDLDGRLREIDAG
ncbi:hypothetical protein [Sphingomonas sp.]|uniref:hypothetical protein n=1 Tax=Sphingomonas sp. TaxID=28214 RepID=UPI001B158532|nr:hypothetical protein [Sphingomonas sp.]MBO9713537.1 hypothetical protein [Sphingomonas sp.]